MKNKEFYDSKIEKEEICECGHDRRKHMILKRINYERCGVNLCSCKKFKPKRLAREPKDEFTFEGKRYKVEGNKAVEQNSFCLSSKRIDIAPSGYGNHTEFVYPEEKVKKAVQLLKEDYDKRIDKIQKSFKTTEDPFVAMKRFELMKILCGFVDNLDKLAGPDLI